MHAQTQAAPARTLANRAYQQIRGDIIRGRLTAGTKLKLESLVQHYEIGMSPLREALARLVGDHFVITEDQRGFWVAPLSLQDLDDISRVRNLVENEALGLSIEHGDTAWEQQLREVFDYLSEIEAGLSGSQNMLPEALLDDWEHRNRLLHQALVSACGSPWLIKLQALLYDQAERYRRIALTNLQGKRFVHDEHVAVVAAALERNPLKACRLNQEHLMRTYEEVRSAVSQDGSLFGPAQSSVAESPD